MYGGVRDLGFLKIRSPLFRVPRISTILSWDLYLWKLPHAGQSHSNSGMLRLPKFRGPFKEGDGGEKVIV